MTKEKKKKTKHKPNTAKRRADEKLDIQQLNDNIFFNTTLVFARQSLLHETYIDLQQAFINVLINTASTEGFCPPIASGAKREKMSRRTVETLLANILNIKDKSTLAINLDQGKYSHTRLSGSGLINLIRLASHKSHRLLILKKGFQDLREPKNSRTARIKPLDKFYELMETNIINEDDIISQPDDLINLHYKTGKGRNKKTETISRKVWIKNISSELYKQLLVIESSLKWFNLVIGEYDITYSKEADGKTHYLFPNLYAIYNNDFQHGGRFYTAKGGHQGLTKEERKTIRFNNLPTTELDFGGLHIRMLYHLEGLNYPRNKCPYMAVLRAMGKNPKRILTKYPDIKRDLKTIVFGLVNGKITQKQNMLLEAVNRVEYNLFNNLDESKDTRENRKKHWHKLGLLDTNNNKPIQIVRAFQKEHKGIEDKFYSGCGLYLQNIDAQIAYWILAEMMFSEKDRCVPCLPIHDSFISFSAYENKLKNAMKMVYKTVIQQLSNTEKSYEIPIK